MNKIIVSRTDSIGDVLLTLPVCAWLKERFPTLKIIFLGKEYTRQISEAYTIIDEFLSEEELLNLPTSQRIAILQADAILHVFPNKIIASLAKKAKVPLRIGTSHRAFHLLTCNKRVSFTRKKSELHEAQLNFNLLKPLGLSTIPELQALQQYTRYFQVKPMELPEILSTIDLKKAIILHPKSKGSALEWPVESYLSLTVELIKRQIPVLFTGTKEEGNFFRQMLPSHPLVVDTSGHLSLAQLILLISKVNGLVACSTGPYHLAGFCGIRAVGLFSEKRPIHPGRWHALGKNSTWITFDKNCPNCRKRKNCLCIEQIPVSKVLNALLSNA